MRTRERLGEEGFRHTEEKEGAKRSNGLERINVSEYGISLGCQISRAFL